MFISIPWTVHNSYLVTPEKKRRTTLTHFSSLMDYIMGFNCIQCILPKCARKCSQSIRRCCYKMLPFIWETLLQQQTASIIRISGDRSFIIFFPADLKIQSVITITYKTTDKYMGSQSEHTNTHSFHHIPVGTWWLIDGYLIRHTSLFSAIMSTTQRIGWSLKT